MKIKVLFLLSIISFSSYTLTAQRGVRIGYIDTEYILQNVPEYQEASSQLDSKVQKWKSEIEAKLGQVEQKRNDLSNESVLLTPELVKEREEDILFEETEILDYQQKRFGPNGDLMIQKKQLIQPIQDQIFAAVQDIAANRKYDFVFDKSADLTMLYSADRFDISEQVLRTITRASKRKQIQNKKDKKALEDEDVVPIIDKEAEAKQKEIEANKAARAKAAEDKRQEALLAREAKKKEALERRQKILDERAKKKAEQLEGRKKLPFDVKPDENLENGTPFEKEDKEGADSTSDEEKNAKEVAADKNTEEQPEKIVPKTREERKKELEERKKKILEARAKAKEERTAKKKAQDSIKNNDN
jgi:Skp family chaperone for outer membrane proteins